MLKVVEREKLQDCLMLIQSARHLLLGLRPELIADVAELEKCFQDADKKISRLLRS